MNRGLYGKLAVNNIKHNRQFYLPYLLTGMLTVAFFYTMLYLNHNPGLDELPFGAMDVELVLGLGAVIIGFFSVIFLFYTNSFIMKRRKKELGIYNILGMEKRHLTKVIFLETFFSAVGAIGGGLVAGINAVYGVVSASKILVGIVFGGLFSLVILLGMHWAVTPILLGIMAEQGFEPALAAGGMGNYAALGICLAVAVFAKNAGDKTTAGSAAFTNALCGITEPGLYGIILRSKWLLGTMIVSGAAAGLVLGIGGVAATNFSFSGLLAFSGWFGCVNFPMYCVGIIVSIVLGFGITAFLLKSGKVKEYD